MTEDNLMKNHLTVFLFVLMTAIPSTALAANGATGALPAGLKTGYFIPADGDLDNTMTSGLEFDFAMGPKHLLSMEFLVGASANCRDSAPGAVTHECKAVTQVMTMSVITRSKKSAGLYFGLGLANVTHRISLLTSIAPGETYFITSQPSRTGLLFTLGYGKQDTGFMLEGRYLMAGKKRWNPFSDAGTDMGGLFLSGGYIYMIK
jgi:hypothetical protein